MTITTEEAERLANGIEDAHSLFVTAAALRSLAAERGVLRAENARIKELLKEVGSLAASRAGRVDVLEAENARMREALGQINAQSIETFCINPEGGANIVVDGHERFAFESDVIMLLNIARAPLGEKE